jgi:hypothetical protein
MIRAEVFGSHPFRKVHGMDGARNMIGQISEKQPQILRLASLVQDDSLKYISG